MTNIKKFDYENHTITFEFTDGNKMVNATQMAKPFGKFVGHFLAVKRTKEYIILLKERYRNSDNEKNRCVIKIIKAGDAKLQGTWMDEKLALKFAAWLAPQFELWVYDRIHELLTTGKTELKTKPGHSIIKSIRLIADQLEAQEQDIENLKTNVSDIKNHMDYLEAKITSIDENYYSISGYCNLNVIDCPLDKAKKWGFAATKLSHQLERLIGKAYDAKYGNINTYHKDILKKIIK